MMHTEECLAFQARLQAAHDEYVAKWPDYCKSCGGAGEVTWYENGAPFGSGENWPMQLGDICDACSGAGNCPRCGQPAWTDDELEDWDTPCPHCGWKPGDASCPDTWDGMCGCFQEYEDAFMGLEPEIWEDDLNDRAHDEWGNSTEEPEDWIDF